MSTHRSLCPCSPQGALTNSVQGCFEEGVRKVSLSFLSYNAGLLRVGMGYEPVPHVGRRLAVIPSAITRVRADVVALQEVYEDRDREEIHHRIRHHLPHRAYVRGGRFRYDSGLMTLSRHPHASRLVRFERGAFEEQWIGWKSVLISDLNVPGVGALTVLNLHATAGGLFTLPDHPSVEALREHQMRQVVELASRAHGIPVILGDFNAGPGVADKNYRCLLGAGYVDVYGHLHPESAQCTWDPRNLLSADGPHRACPPQRIDHVFVRASDIESGRVAPVEARVVFSECEVRLPGGGHVTPSDHYGLLTRLEFERG